MAIQHPTNDDLREICDSVGCSVPHARKAYWKKELALELQLHDADLREVLAIIVKELL